MIRIRLEEERKVAAMPGTNEGKESREGGVVVFEAVSGGGRRRVCPPGLELRRAEGVGQLHGEREGDMIPFIKFH